MEVRPLDLGEIFDRSINLYARNFQPFVRLALVAIVPLAVVQYFALRVEGPQLDAMIAVWQHPERVGSGHFPTIFDSPTAFIATAVSVVVGYLLTSFAVCAVAVATSELYRHERLAVAAAYRPVLARWPAIVGVLGIALGVLIICYAVTVLVVSIPLIVGAMVATAAALIFPVVGLIAVIAMFFALALILVTAAFAFFGVVVEGQGVATSVPIAASRIFRRVQLGRALICSVAAGAVMTIPAGLIDTVTYVGAERWPAGYVVLDAMVRCVMLPFGALILAVYYFDVRARGDGLDQEDTIFADDADDAGYAPTAYLSGRERAMIKRFLELRNSLPPRRRRTIAAQLARPVRERVPEDLRTLDDESLLERL